MSVMNATSAPARASAESNARTWEESALRKVRSASGGARACEGCAAISHDGQGVGTEPI